MKTTTTILMLLLCFGSAQGGKANRQEEYSRVIRKEFAINPDAQLIINNKYGKIHCNIWDKNAVQIEVTVTVDANRQETAEKIMDRISVAFSNAPEKVEARTLVQDIRVSGNKYFSIDYTVYVPATVNLDLTNKFGDIYIQETAGKCRINLSYGNLDAKKLGHGDNLLEIQFGKGAVNWIKGAVLTLKYSNFKTEYAGSLRMDSKFSDSKISKAVALNVSQEGGQLDVGNTSVFVCKSKFSEIEVDKLEQSMEMDIQYGSCDIREVSPDFTSIMVQNKYGDISVRLPATAKYKLDANLRFCTLDFPESKGKFSFKSKEHTNQIFRGVINGGDTEPSSSVKITSDFGSVSLQ